MHTKDQGITIQVKEDLLLREVTLDDSPAIYKLIDANRNYLGKWLPFVTNRNNASHVEAYIRSVTGPGNISDLVFVVLYKEKHVGVIGCKGIDLANLKLEIGYWLVEDQQGKGIMRLSCAALIKYAFEIMQMNRIQIKVGVGNHRSNNIPKKLHFTFEGLERDGEMQNNGHFHDLEIYGLLRKEWENHT